MKATTVESSARVWAAACEIAPTSKITLFSSFFIGFSCIFTPLPAFLPTMKGLTGPTKGYKHPTKGFQSLTED
jgi:hypothetical protein